MLKAIMSFARLDRKEHMEEDLPSKSLFMNCTNWLNAMKLILKLITNDKWLLAFFAHLRFVTSFAG